MQYAISTTSATLESIIGAVGMAQANAAKPQGQPYYNVVISNPGAIAVYFEIAGAASSGSTYIPVASGATPGYAFIKTDNIAKIQLIAASGTPNVNVTFG